jgi:excinuclease ABC subunit C
VKGKADDYSAMREVLRRYFVKEKGAGDLSDLVIVDGGKGQLNIALEVFDELSIASVDAIGLAKQDARHDKGLTQESIYLPYRKDPILIDRHSPLLFLLQTIRDEAHRVAIGYHRKQRSKRTLSSELDEMKGIGPVKKKRLLQRFGSLIAIRNATDEELLEVPGIGLKDIQALRGS